MSEKSSGSPHGEAAVSDLLLSKIGGSGGGLSESQGVEAELARSAISALLSLGYCDAAEYYTVRKGKKTDYNLK